MINFKRVGYAYDACYPIIYQGRGDPAISSLSYYKPLRLSIRMSDGGPVTISMKLAYEQIQGLLILTIGSSGRTYPLSSMRARSLFAIIKNYSYQLAHLI